uniref:Uncharacterized protein n=1 Tax=Anguilla anguilla TaxID=7936 RepID=A0A0E9PPM0_ANGAN
MILNLYPSNSKSPNKDI